MIYENANSAGWRNRLITRAKIIKAIRQFFDERGFTEMFTPRLVGLPGQEPNLEPFWTRLLQDSGGQAELDVALITSPEYAMKRLLASGFDKIFDLGPCFRNEEPWDGSHDPEFLLLEWYRRDAELEDILKDTEEMVRFVASTIHDSRFTIHDTPFRRLSVKEAMKHHAGIDLDKLLDHPETLPDIVRAHGQTVSSKDSFDDLFYKIFLSKVEPALGWNKDRTEYQPTFLTYYPAAMAALARRNPEDPRYALRAELYIGDLELANGFAELADPDEQRERFLEERALRQAQGKKVWALDERFLSALPDMGNAAGIAFGVDRLVMLLTGATSINDVLPFPAHERFQPEAERK
ncbi:MAG: EF-P lysine aminoacylase EpmA [Candidatus Uhrbacteria bacterium]|nr:EF-P lysine aminoacylase EpmA [Candidatus Uhrbacteria bacterium]